MVGERVTSGIWLTWVQILFLSFIKPLAFIKFPNLLVPSSLFENEDNNTLDNKFQGFSKD